MGQIFNRFKRIVKSNVGPIIDSVTDTISGALSKNDFLKKKWEESRKLRDNIGDKFDEGQEHLKDAWNDLTTSIPYSLKSSYEVLGVPFGLPLEDVRKAWRKLILEHHPDKSTTEKERAVATRKAAGINEAFQKIEDYFSKNKS
ncbi:MAG: J domain-containing protein [Candidatus Vogelbacteria bacterium]|nr:J domain-containing protein [Candidatus Vogelbacteria bacterium]